MGILTLVRSDGCHAGAALAEHGLGRGGGGGGAWQTGYDFIDLPALPPAVAAAALVKLRPWAGAARQHRQAQNTGYNKHSLRHWSLPFRYVDR